MSHDATDQALIDQAAQIHAGDEVDIEEIVADLREVLPGIMPDSPVDRILSAIEYGWTQREAVVGQAMCKLGDTCIERDKLAAFKTFVHGAIDRMGVPADPPGKHRDEGCRIGQRLEWIAERLPSNPTVRSAIKDAMGMYENTVCLDLNRNVDLECCDDCGADAGEECEDACGRAAAENHRDTLAKLIGEG